jgi:hypothetical protein
LEGALNTHQNSAVFFALTIQLTTVIFRVRGDYGAVSVGLSGGSLEMGWTVSLLTLVPLLYPLVIEVKEGSALTRPHLNLLFILFCTLLHGDIALSRLSSAISPPLTGIPLSKQEWAFLVDTCYSPSIKISDYELRVSTIVALVESFVVISLAFYKAITIFIPPKKALGVFLAPLLVSTGLREKRKKIIRPMLYLGILPLFAVSQVYALMRLRREQFGIAQHVGYEFTVDEWSFGQIASLLIWMPVLVELGYVWVESRWKGVVSMLTRMGVPMLIFLLNVIDRSILAGAAARGAQPTS